MISLEEYLEVHLDEDEANPRTVYRELLRQMHEVIYIYTDIYTTPRKRPRSILKRVLYYPSKDTHTHPHKRPIVPLKTDLYYTLI